MSVTDNQLSIDSQLPLEAAPLVKPGMKVAIDEQALGIKATGIVETVANTPGTRGVDGYHFYLGVKVETTPVLLAGFSVRLTIPIETSKGAVTAVPTSAVSLAADGTSRVLVDRGGKQEYVTVQPGLSTGGYVEVNTPDGQLAPGQLVVVGYKTAEPAAARWRSNEAHGGHTAGGADQDGFCRCRPCPRPAESVQAIRDRSRGRRIDRCRPRVAARRMAVDNRSVRLGEIHAAEYPRLPRPANQRTVSF